MSEIASAEVVYAWRIGNVEFDEGRRELRVAGCVIDLEPRPLEIFLQLLRHAGEVVTKDDLLDAVYGHRHLSDGAVAQAIRRLRRALNDNDQKIIATVHRVGYKLIAEVRRTPIPSNRTRELILKVGDPVPRREHWRLLTPLGGEAVDVWLIEHEKTHHRRVLKLATGAAQLSALKREVTLYRVLIEALGQRDDLFELIDWSFDSSPFFIECEYGGITLNEWAESLGGLASIELSMRVEMLALAADAVAAAHGANVLHKDLKPSNILAYRIEDASWRVRLIDFGCGRVLDADRLEALRITQLGFTQQRLIGEDSMSGTPLYQAPELLAAQVPTVQSDVYALGVILYQLVIGDFRKPVASGWEDDIDDLLLREDIASATHGNPAKRMGSAAELARRLRSRATRLSSASLPTPRATRSAGISGRVVALTGLLAACAAVAGWQIRVHQRPSEIPMSTVANRESIDDYQQVLTISHQRHESRADQVASIKTLEHAVELSPAFANAWALLARENAHLYFAHFETEKRRFAATQALQKAIELQPDAPDTLIAKGYYSYWVEGNYAEAARNELRVHERWPERSDATIALARISRRQNRYADAARYFEEALAQDRLNMEWALGAASANVVLRQFTNGLRLVNHALDIEPTDTAAIGLKSYIFEASGDLAGASAALNALPKRPGDFATVSLIAEHARLTRQYPTAISMWRTYLAAPEQRSEDDATAAKQQLAHLLLLTGDAASSMALLRETREELEKQRGSRPADPWPLVGLALVYADMDYPTLARTLAESVSSFDVVKNDADRVNLIDLMNASVAARLGDKDRALEILSHLLKRAAGETITPSLLALDPEWDSLRSDPRYAALVKDRQ